MLKIRKEKKVLEQRNKNISYNKNSNEMDQLKQKTKDQSQQI